MAAGAALLLMQPGHGMVVVEWSRCRLSISAVAAEGVLVHANHCVSELQDESHAGIAKLLAESKQRQAEVEGRYADELVAGKLPLELKQIQSFLSGAVQNDDVLATVVSCPQRRELYVRFRLQVPGMELVEDTVACDFWQLFFENLHKYKAIPGDLALLGRAKTAAEQLRSLQRVYSQSLKGVQLANAVAQELEDWSRVAAPELQRLEDAPARAEAPPKELSKKQKKQLKKDKKREKKAMKAEKKAAKTLAKIEEAAKQAEMVTSRAKQEEAEASQRIAEVEAELEAAEAEAAAAEESSEDPETVARTERLRAQLSEAYEQSAQVALRSAEQAEA
ncbi:unnamed protein product, partial [Effrenium voratum]